MQYMRVHVGLAIAGVYLVRCVMVSSLGLLRVWSSIHDDCGFNRIGARNESVSAPIMASSSMNSKSLRVGQIA